MSGTGDGLLGGGVYGPPLGVAADQPPHHSADSGLTPGQAAEADRAEAQMGVVQIEGAAGTAAVAPPQASGGDTRSPDDAPLFETEPSPEDAYGGRGPNYVGIAHSETAFGATADEREELRREASNPPQIERG